MYFLPTIREVEDFSTLLQTSTSSQSNEGFSSTQSRSYSAYTSIEDGNSVFATDVTFYTTASISFVGQTQEAMESAVGGTTRSANATMTSSTALGNTLITNSAATEVNSTSTATTSFSSTDSATNSFASSMSLTFFYGITSEQPATLTQTTTSNVDTTLTRPAVLSGSLSSESFTTSVVGTTTQTQDTTTIGFDTTSSEFSNYMEEGSILVTEATDWVWSVTNYDSFAPFFISDMASSLGGTTVWADTVTNPVSYVAVPSDYSTVTGTMSANTSTYSWEYTFFGSESNPVTITSGESLARTTTTIDAGSIDTSTSDLTAGNDSYTVIGDSSTTITTTAVTYDNYQQTTLYGEGFLNSSTTELNTLTSWVTTTTSNAIPLTYYSNTSSVNSLGTSEGGFSIAETDLLTRGVSLFAFGGAAQGIVRAAPFGAFVSPSDLRSDGEPFHFGTNLSFPGSVLPYNTLDSVYNSVQTPAPFAFSTTGEGGTLTWKFAWAQDTLKITQQSTLLSGTQTVTHSTQTSGVFGVESNSSSYFADGGSVFGGYPYISTAKESVFFPPRAVIGTSNFDGGGSTTYKTIETDSSSTEIAEDAVVENTIPAFIIWTDVDGAGLPNAALLVYPRNPL